MLISFSFGNWLSFREKATFSMVAGSEKGHPEHLARVNKFDLRLLPTASIYGGNASGKTNFVKALAFAKNLVVRGTQVKEMLPVEPFLLDSAAVNEPCTFLFELLINEKIYEFSFTVTAKSVVDEKLVLVNSSSETVLYHRKKPGRKLLLSDTLKKKEFLEFAFQGTRTNQLYLTNAVSQNVNIFQPVYEWFKSALVLISPETRIEQFEYYLRDRNPRHEVMNRALAELDTGIRRLGSETIPLESIQLSEEAMRVVRETTQEGVTSRIHFSGTNERIVVTREKNEVKAEKIVTYHKRSDGTEIKFELNRESSGSQRVLDLLPFFIEATTTPPGKVYVIDELDRSLHTLLTKQLLEAFLESRTPKSRSQIIFTTHDLLLMDQEILRRDEMWVTERDKQGRSQLFSLVEYKDLRNDTDLRKRYLQGRLGGIPQILLTRGLTADPEAPKRARGAS